jgi:four helix bundle protein
MELTFQFALNIFTYSDLLNENRKFVFANQLLRSGTSIGANVREAQNAESKADFIHKLKIAAKEANETEYWLQLCKHAPEYPDPIGLLEDLVSINKVLNKIISSSKVGRTLSNQPIIKSSNS